MNETQLTLTAFGGWILLSAHITDYGHPIERHQNTIFSMGWPKSLGVVRHYETDRMKQNREKRAKWKMENDEKLERLVRQAREQASEVRPG